MTLDEIRSKRQAAAAQAEPLAALDTLTDDQQAAFDSAIATVDECDAQIKALEDSAKAAAERRERLARINASGRKTASDTPDIRVGKARVADDPARGFKSPREYLTAVMNASYGRVDPRLSPLRATAGSDEHSTFDDSRGGFLVPEAYSPNVMSVSAEADPIGAATMKVPMGSPTVNIPARVDKNHSTSVSGGLTVSRRSEAVAASPSRMELERVKLEAAGLFGLTYATEELMTDSPQTLMAIIAAGFNDEFTAKLIDERLNGLGTGGQYLGVLNAPCLVTVAKETGQQADTIEYNNILKMRARCWGYERAIWLANHDTIPQLALLNQSVGTGGVPMWQPTAREDIPSILFGRPIVFTEFCKTIGDVGDIVLGNWSQFLEGTYQPLQSAESMHVRFVEHERAFKFWTRNAGAPWWRSALTPRNSTSTLSPFVTLAAR